MNHLQNHIDNYLVHCQTQKRLDAKTLKAYRIYRLLKQYLSRNYRFFDQFLYQKYRLKNFITFQQKIVCTIQRKILHKNRGYIANLCFCALKNYNS